MICSLTTSLIGANTPTFNQVIKKLSEINIDMDVIFTITEESEMAYMEIVDTTDLGFLESVVAGISNTFAYIYNALYAVIVTLIGLFDFLLQVVDAIFIVFEVAIYLLFGIELNISYGVT